MVTPSSFRLLTPFACYLKSTVRPRKMTTAHRPTWDPVQAKDVKSGKSASRRFSDVHAGHGRAREAQVLVRPSFRPHELARGGTVHAGSLGERLPRRGDARLACEAPRGGGGRATSRTTASVRRGWESLLSPSRPAPGAQPWR